MKAISRYGKEILLGALTAAGMYFLVFFLRLGWFFALIYPGGFLLSLVLAYWMKRSPLRAGASYLLFLALIWLIFVDQTEIRRFQTTWTHDPSPTSQEKLVVFEFRDYPGHFEGIHSNELFNYLSKLPSTEVEVKIETISDFFCFRGHHIVAVGELQNFRNDGMFSQTVNQPAHSPWPTHWWCP